MDSIQHYQSLLGGITMASDGEHLIGLWFDDQQHFASTLDKPYAEKQLPVFQETKQWLDLYFSGKAPNFTPPLLLRGTGFRQEVWGLLRQIPYGQTITYGDIAGKLAAQRGLVRMSAQAVGSAVGHNPISLIIPCHRVIGSDGKLTGYAGGIQRKELLLQMEQNYISQI